jgi:hypothetical protein
MKASGARQNVDPLDDMITELRNSAAVHGTGLLLVASRLRELERAVAALRSAADLGYKPMNGCYLDAAERAVDQIARTAAEAGLTGDDADTLRQTAERADRAARAGGRVAAAEADRCHNAAVVADDRGRRGLADAIRCIADELGGT